MHWRRWLHLLEVAAASVIGGSGSFICRRRQRFYSSDVVDSFVGGGSGFCRRRRWLHSLEEATALVVGGG